MNILRWLFIAVCFVAMVGFGLCGSLGVLAYLTSGAGRNPYASIPLNMGLLGLGVAFVSWLVMRWLLPKKEQKERKEQE
jgi:phosphotransferase system  glucose/maltose/N-acetylglucosamine-specific IIC component